jgi:CPA2 family monovalent cation:H+ antiporter-2
VILAAIGVTIAKVAGFVALMYVIGRRVIPRVLHAVAQERELFRLAVLAIALGVAFGAAKLFGVSFALGAFFAGMVLGESELSHRAAEESVPLREAFAVLFFVAVGMLFNPAIVLSEPAALLATLFIVLVGKSVAAFAIVVLFRHTVGVGMTIAASLAQVGEFSFILAGLGVTVNILPGAGRYLVLAAAMISIVLNPFAFALSARLARRLVAHGARGGAEPAAVAPVPAGGHSILVGYGRVGSLVAAALRESGSEFVVIENDAERVAGARGSGIAVVEGNAASREILDAANPVMAIRLVVAIPNTFEAGRIVKRARTANPRVAIIARAHSDAETRHLLDLGADHVIMGERQIAIEMIAEIERAGAAPTW